MPTDDVPAFRMAVEPLEHMPVRGRWSGTRPAGSRPVGSRPAGSRPPVIQRPVRR